MVTPRRASEIAATTLRVEMAREKYTSVQLARVLHISQQSASRRINGDTPLTLDELAEVSSWLGLSITAFLTEDRASGPGVSAPSWPEVAS